jgi:two-component system cell cycle response regulator
VREIPDSRVPEPSAADFPRQDYRLTFPGKSTNGFKSLTRILLAEDSALYRRLISSHLREWGFDLVIVTDGNEAWDLLKTQDAPNLVLLDWVLPGIEGVELCRKIRQSKANSRYTYIVLLTAKDKKKYLLEGMQAGADDYLVKPFDPDELRARLFVGKRILELQQDLLQARDSLRVAATYDFTTGLLNRRAIAERLEHELSRGRRERKPVGIALADLDHFKRINDSFGHLAGDVVLTEVGKRIKGGLRNYDGAGRYGGEEFLVILPGCDLGHTILRCEGLRELICSHEVRTSAGPVRVTVSIGATVADCVHTYSSESLLRAADTALYRAKDRGRDRVEAHDAKLEVSTRDCALDTLCPPR